jgi:hypothetical protein
LILLASCDNKYHGTNFIDAVPTSLPIAPGSPNYSVLVVDCDQP